MNALFHALHALEAIDGAITGTIVDARAALCLATFGERGHDVETEAALHAQMFSLRSAREQSWLRRADVELIVVHFAAHVHLVASTRSAQPMLVFVALDRADSNLALAMREVRSIVGALEQSRDPVALEPTINAIAS